jgi:hypothetical protein
LLSFSPGAGAALITEKGEPRYRLFRQPSGFKGVGFLMVEVDLDPGREPSLIEGPNGPEEELRLDAATRSSDLGARPNQDLISDRAKIQRLDHLGLEGLWLHPSANPRRTFDWRLIAGRD